MTHLTHCNHLICMKLAQQCHVTMDFIARLLKENLIKISQACNNSQLKNAGEGAFPVWKHYSTVNEDDQIPRHLFNHQNPSS